MAVVIGTLRSFGASLKEERERAGISQRVLGDAIGVTGGAVSQWESDDIVPSPETVFALERALGVPGGRLSRALGYLPVGESNPDVFAALTADQSISDTSRDMLLELYRIARRSGP